ncbi:histidine kinase [Amylolactobacillus amylotrophicus DSM 20534]|uniref:Cell wall metabolism sensor histidine kinase WalK n=3 Tax=Amylolactobacillus TaxID=2767876 RepID=A0A1L6XBZ2_9LACO|nr:MULTISPECIES: cell wall metabolism sensor histidine kinase WalK [Amylolactobacillus]APT18461.1 cell wall metabolism sensor histidine kinase WalK [Amylolactobacillus amylophilus DSM 20533 = JCM 1125]KRK38248.1 histidine kinase [Amylolactobacillus amylotrophicus DSM 20534]KRM43110.1 histidine kinase [Amylolactobacillus amylophilus DSM 20533 = JCM 1125]
MNNKLKLFQSINFKVAMVFILLLLATIEIIGAYFTRQLEQNSIDSFETSVQVPSIITSQISAQIEQKDKKSANQSISSILNDYDNSQISDIEVVDNDGVIRAVSNINYTDRVGQKTASADIKSSSYTGRETTKFVRDNGVTYLVKISPLAARNGNSTNGVIYIRASMEQVFKDVKSTTITFLTASLVAAILGSILSLVISRAITRPIDEMKKQAIRMASGDYSGQVRVYSHDELGQLAMAVNNLSVRVEEAQEVSESERRRLDNVLTHMTDGVIATDRHGNVTIINDMALSFLNKEEGEVIGESITDLLGLSAQMTTQDLMSNQQELIIGINEGTARELILHANFSLIQRVTGFVSGLICVLYDVTEQQKNEREQRQFVSNVSHELRTPLTSLRSYVEALNDGAWKDPEIAPKFLQVTQGETERMIRMINDLLSLSRLDQGTARMELEWVNLNEFFGYILDRFDMMIKNTNEDDANQKKYSIKREFASRELWVEIDPDKMTQVLDNIMNNAIKYSPDGGVITTRLLQTHNHVIMSISDQGLGIPRKDLNKIFDRFYRVDQARSRQQGGTGLGLAISKEVVEAHHGRIWADSAEDRGSTFYISLPFEPISDGGEWDEV